MVSKRFLFSILLVLCCLLRVKVGSLPETHLQAYSFMNFTEPKTSLDVTATPSPSVPTTAAPTSPPKPTSNSSLFSELIASKAINNAIILMIVDYGYLPLLENSYTCGHLSDYKNLVILCLDEQSYSVRSSCSL